MPDQAPDLRDWHCAEAWNFSAIGGLFPNRKKRFQYLFGGGVWGRAFKRGKGMRMEMGMGMAMVEEGSEVGLPLAGRSEGWTECFAAAAGPPSVFSFFCNRGMAMILCA